MSLVFSAVIKLELLQLVAVMVNRSGPRKRQIHVETLLAQNVKMQTR